MGQESFRDRKVFPPQTMERGVALYEHFLGIAIRDFSGKNILNIGSGDTGLFEKAVADAGGMVFTISPHFSHESAGKMRANYKHMNVFPISAKVSRYSSDRGGLPIKHDSMDVATALYSLPVHFPEIDLIEVASRFFEDVLDLLKSGGKAIIYPIPESKVFYYKKVLSSIGAGNINFIEINEEDNDTVYKGERAFRLEFIK